MAIANGENDMDKNEVLKILETAKDENGEVPMRLLRQAFEKLPEPCGDTVYRQDAIDGVKTLHDVAWKNWHEPTLSANVVLDMIGELPSAQPVLTCDGCMHVGIFDTDFPCNVCVRRAKDYYESE